MRMNVHAEELDVVCELEAIGPRGGEDLSLTDKVFQRNPALRLGERSIGEEAGYGG